MDCSLPGFSVHAIFQARILEWVAISSSREPSRPRYGTLIYCIAGGFFMTEPPGKLKISRTMVYLQKNEKPSDTRSIPPGVTQQALRHQKHPSGSYPASPHFICTEIHCKVHFNTIYGNFYFILLWKAVGLRIDSTCWKGRKPKLKALFSCRGVLGILQPLLYERLKKWLGGLYPQSLWVQLTASAELGPILPSL